MKKSVSTLASVVILVAAPVPGQQASKPATQDDGALVITRRGAQIARQGEAANFTGSVRVEQAFQAKEPARASGAVVTFEPGARTAWHSHPLGQTLIVTSGVGRVQRWGDPVEEIRPGDIVWTPPGQKHWHGASPTERMAHIAIGERLDGKSVEWMEKVTDDQYNASPRPRPAGAMR
jgi:4-carboxymuconolactone decarboxylase